MSTRAYSATRSIDIYFLPLRDIHGVPYLEKDRRTSIHVPRDTVAIRERVSAPQSNAERGYVLVHPTKHFMARHVSKDESTIGITVRE